MELGGCGVAGGGEWGWEGQRLQPTSHSPQGSIPQAARSQQSVIPRGSPMAPVKISYIVSFSSQVSGCFLQGGGALQSTSVRHSLIRQCLKGTNYSRCVQITCKFCYFWGVAGAR